MEENKNKVYYKGFNKDMTCRGFQYEEGKTYETDKAELCKEGFHACENPIDCLIYYEPNHSEYHIVELDGVSDERDNDSKVVAKKITIGRKIDFHEMAQAAADYVKQNTKGNVTTSKTRDSSVASNTGNYSVASNTGKCSVASNTGYKSVSSNTGVWSVATNTGDKSVAINNGDCSVSSNTGFKSVASNTGDKSVAINDGYCSVAEASGKESIAIVTGKDGMAKGALGCWLVLTERDDDWNIISVQSFKVDGKKVKADTWYTLVGGKLEEC